jgi:amidase
VKDCIAVAGVPTTNAGRRTPHLVPIEDALVVERLLDAGAVIRAKTNLDDLALGLGEGSAYGTARNPINPDYSAGGSSSGTAAAVATGLVDLGVAADEAGSIRIPAAWCGLVGMKPTHGLVPSYGLTYMDHTIDHVGPITKTVFDNAQMLQAMAGADERDPQARHAAPDESGYVPAPHPDVAGLRVGAVTESLEASSCAPDVLRRFQAAVSALSDVGAVVTTVSLSMWPSAVPLLLACLSHGIYGMASSHGVGYGHLGRVDPHAVAVFGAQQRLQGNDLPWALKTMLLTAEHLRRQYQNVPVARAANLRMALRQQVNHAFANLDVLVTPTTPAVARETIDGRVTTEEFAARGDIRAVLNTAAFDLTGHPALTVPYGTGEHGLPVGVQLVGPHFEERRLYRVARALEERMGSE